MKPTTTMCTGFLPNRRYGWLHVCLLLSAFLCFSTVRASDTRVVVRVHDEWISLDSLTRFGLQHTTDSLQFGTVDSTGRVIPDGTLHLPQGQAVWQNKWLIGGATFVIAIMLYLLFRYLLSRSRREALLKAQLADLERSALQAQMNPHFIFNSLNSIQSYIANNENDKANRFLAKFSRLIRAMLNNSRSSRISLSEEIDSLTLYLELEKMRFKEKFDFEITVDADLEPEEIKLPPLLIQPYLEN
ncbi:MAG: histidine kinase, partial [Flavobacteriales bacterium]|nr:histidine kinase [Flavobacteriales bacterium]